MARHKPKGLTEKAVLNRYSGAALKLREKIRNIAMENAQQHPVLSQNLFKAVDLMEEDAIARSLLTLAKMGQFTGADLGISQGHMEGLIAKSALKPVLKTAGQQTGDEKALTYDRDKWLGILTSLGLAGGYIPNFQGTHSIKDEAEWNTLAGNLTGQRNSRANARIRKGSGFLT